MRRAWFSLPLREFVPTWPTSWKEDEDTQFDWQPIVETLKRLASSTSSLSVTLNGKPNALDSDLNGKDSNNVNVQPIHEPFINLREGKDPLPLNDVATAQDCQDGPKLNIEVGQEQDNSPRTSAFEFCNNRTGLPYFLSDDQLELLNRSQEVLDLLEQKSGRVRARKDRRRKPRVLAAWRNKFRKPHFASGKIRGTKRVKHSSSAGSGIAPEVLNYEAGTMDNEQGDVDRRGTISSPTSSNSSSDLNLSWLFGDADAE